MAIALPSYGSSESRAIFRESGTPVTVCVTINPHLVILGYSRDKIRGHAFTRVNFTNKLNGVNTKTEFEKESHIGDKAVLRSLCP